MEEILYGAVCSYLRETFKDFVSLQDHNMVLEAFEDFCSADTDELMDFLENYECRKKVTAEILMDVLYIKSLCKSHCMWQNARKMKYSQILPLTTVSLLRWMTT